MLYNRLLYWFGYLAGWNGGVRSDPALPPASQQAHVLAHPHVPALGSQPHCKVTFAKASTLAIQLYKHLIILYGCLVCTTLYATRCKLDYKRINNWKYYWYRVVLYSRKISTDQTSPWVLLCKYCSSRYRFDMDFRFKYNYLYHVCIFATNTFYFNFKNYSNKKYSV